MCRCMHCTDRMVAWGQRTGCAERRVALQQLGFHCRCHPSRLWIAAMLHTAAARTHTRRTGNDPFEKVWWVGAGGEERECDKGVTVAGHATETATRGPPPRNCVLKASESFLSPHQTQPPCPRPRRRYALIRVDVRELGNRPGSAFNPNGVVVCNAEISERGGVRHRRRRRSPRRRRRW